MKKNLPSKICIVCNKPFNWRKKWERDWKSVLYCSKKCSKNKLSESELIKLNDFTNSWYTEVFDTETIINIIDDIGGFELINNKRFIKPSIHWINAVRNSSLKEYHNARTSAIPPIRGADFLYKKI